jgi:hypothetical protein
MLSREGQCGIDTAKTNATDVIPVATMDRPDGYSHMYLSEFTLYSASVLNFYGSTHYFAALKSVGPPYSCPTFNAMLVDPLHPEPLLKQIFTWRSHLGRCGGDGRCMQAHEIVKLSLKRLTLFNSNPGGVAFPSNQLLIEPRHLRSDDSRPGDLYAIAGGLHAKYAAMDLMITSSLSKSTLLHTSKSSDYSLRIAENTKFTKDLRSTYPLQRSAAQRFIPLVLNQCRKRGPHFEATLKEFANQLIKRFSGCNLLHGPFSLPPTVALAKVL